MKIAGAGSIPTVAADVARGVLPKAFPEARSCSVEKCPSGPYPGDAPFPLRGSKDAAHINGIERQRSMTPGFHGPTR